MRDVIEVQLGGMVYSLRPTWGAYAEIESRTSTSIRALWYRFATGDVKLAEMATILTAGMKAYDPAANIGEQAALRAIFEAGPWWDQADGIGTRLIEYLEALGWSPEQREKIQAEVEKEATERARSA